MSCYLYPLALSWLEAWHALERKRYDIRVAVLKAGGMSVKFTMARHLPMARYIPAGWEGSQLSNRILPIGKILGFYTFWIPYSVVR